MTSQEFFNVFLEMNVFTLLVLFKPLADSILKRIYDNQLAMSNMLATSHLAFHFVAI